LTLAFTQIILLPLDASNAKGMGFRMDTFWMIIFYCVLIFISVIGPFSLFYYDCDDEDPLSTKICTAIKYEFFCALAVVVIFLATYFFLSTSSLPYTLIKCPSNSFEPSKANQASVSSNCQYDTGFSFDYSTGFNSYMVSLMSFVGWLYNKVPFNCISLNRIFCSSIGSYIRIY